MYKYYIYVKNLLRPFKFAIFSIAFVDSDNLLMMKDTQYTFHVSLKTSSLSSYTI